MTHQEIADRIQAVKDELPQDINELRRLHGERLKALRDMCGLIGHIFSGWPSRSCVVCDAREIREAGPVSLFQIDAKPGATSEASLKA